MLDGWHDFYGILAMAAGTLIGAMFIVASIGGRNMTRTRAAAVASFVTPTVIHLSVVLLACALLAAPTLARQSLGLIAGVGGLIGLATAVRICWWVLRRKVDHVDRLWYGGLPVLEYVGIVAAGAMVLARIPGDIETLAAALGLLVVASIRNAWDLIIYLVGEDRSAP
ncbi:MAG: hypothetical protein KGL11_13935 [Alphaproteobacteria bacterium]|nr:hypothetical protein [Alphaproteobacteria bacterium]